MADSYRIKIEDQTGPGPIENASQQESKGKSASSRVLDTSGSSTSGGKISTNDSGSTAISLASNDSKLPAVGYSVSSNIEVTNNDDIFSEAGSDNYKISNINNTEEVIANGEEYGKIANVIASTLEASMGDTLGSYSTVKDVQQNVKDGAAALLYGMLGSVINNISSNNSGSTTGQGGLTDGDGYNQTNDNITAGSNATASTSVTNGGGIGSAAFSLSLGKFDPDVSLLKVADTALDVFQENDYSKIDDSINDKFSGNGVNYNSSGISLDFSNEGKGMSEWETMTYPDAMSNMYDVYFRVRNDEGEDSSLKPAQGILKALFDNDLLSARITSIEIPAYQRQTAVINFQGASVEKPLDGIETPGQSSFTIRGDTRLYYVTAFNELAGTGLSNLFGKGTIIAEELENKYVKEATDDHNTRMAQWQEAADALEKQYQENFKKAADIDALSIISIYTNSEKTLTQQKELYDYFTKKKTEHMLSSDSLGGDYLYALESYISDSNNNRQEAADNRDKKIKEAKQNNESIFSYIKEKRKINSEYNNQCKILDERMATFQSIINNNTKMKDAVTAKYESKKAELDKDKVILENSYRAKLAGIEYDPLGFDYITTTINKNTSIVVTQIDEGKSGNDEKMVDFLKKYKHLDIIVKRTTPSNRFRTKLSDKKDERFIFEDVKILGTSNAISFKKDSADAQEFTYNFIYKRFYKEDLYDTAGEWVKSQTEAYVGKVVNAVSGLLENKLSKDEFSNKLKSDLAAASGMSNYNSNISKAGEAVAKALRP